MQRAHKCGLTKPEFFASLASVRLGQRLLWAARHDVRTRDGQPWIILISDGAGKRGVRTIIDTESVEAAWRRIRAGEWPPEMPSEKAARSARARD